MVCLQISLNKVIEMRIEEKIKLNELYDIYSELLTEKQREYYEYYYMQDYSLSEISDLLGVSRNAVHMQLKNVVKYLEQYEETLQIMKKKEQISSLIKKIDQNTITMEEIKSELEKV